MVTLDHCEKRLINDPKTAIYWGLLRGTPGGRKAEAVVCPATEIPMMAGELREAFLTDNDVIGIIYDLKLPQDGAEIASPDSASQETGPRAPPVAPITSSRFPLPHGMR